MTSQTQNRISEKQVDSALRHARTLAQQSRHRKANFTSDTQLDILHSHFDSITESISEGVIIFDQFGVIEYFSGVASQIFGYVSEEIIGRSVALLLPGGMKQDELCIGQKKDGTQVSLSIEISKKEVGRQSEFLCVVSEADSARRLTNQLEKEKDNVEQAHQKRVEWVNKLRQNISAVLHDGMAEVEWLFPQFQSEKTKSSLLKLRRNNASLLAMLDHLTEIVDLEVNSEKRSLSTVTLEKLVSEIKEQSRALVAKKDLDLEFEAKGRLPNIVTTHQKTICRIMSQLVRNAVQFTNVGSIKVAWEMIPEEETPPYRMYFQVTDTGRGLSKSMEKQIFEPFMRKSEERDDSNEHFGLGLPLVQELAKSINGIIEYNPGEISGSSFSLIIDVGEFKGWHESESSESESSNDEATNNEATEAEAGSED